MSDFLQSAYADAQLWILAALFIFGALAFLISTISGGGGALILVPILNWMLGARDTAPVLNLGSFIGRPARLIIFWQHIDWKVVVHYAPAAIIGALLGSWLFSHFEIVWLRIFIGIFLISTVFQYRLGKVEKSFHMRLWYFMPLGLGVSILSTVTGALGPVLNPFYLNLGLDKEDLIATKTANSFIMGISQIGGYTSFGLLHSELWVYGIALGAGAIIGNILGKRFLSRMKRVTFRQLLILLMVISGILMIYSELSS